MKCSSSPQSLESSEKSAYLPAWSLPAEVTFAFLALLASSRPCPPSACPIDARRGQERAAESSAAERRAAQPRAEHQHTLARELPPSSQGTRECVKEICQIARSADWKCLHLSFVALFLLLPPPLLLLRRRLGAVGNIQGS